MNIIFKDLFSFSSPAYPLGAVYRNLKTSTTVKNIYIAVTGLAIVLFNYGFDLYHSLLAVAVTYLFNTFFATSSLLVPLSFCYHLSYLLVGKCCLAVLIIS